MTYKPLHCWDCGTRVIGGVQGQYAPLPNFRQVKFRLSDGSYCESPFCQDCANATWTLGRAKEFEAAVNSVSPLHQISVVAVEGRSLLTEPILAILEPHQAIQLNTR